jgi:tRNA 2-selenouridine synthase
MEIFKSQPICIIDVRAPIEFNEGHIPSAINIPLLDDEMRRRVGIIYKEKGRGAAIEEGLKLVNMGHLVEEIRIKLSSYKDGDSVGLYCFRGGLRSECMGWLLRLLGYKVKILEGGYKSFRRWVRGQFCKNYDMVILSGKTNVGKTEIIEMMGSRAINLERMANHKGSVFGGFDGVQPTQQMFENILGVELSKIMGRFFIEDESRNIGKVKIPDEFFFKMRKASVVVLEDSIENRVKRCVDEYGKYAKGDLKRAIEWLKKHLGYERSKEAFLLLDRGDYDGCCRVLFEYYDRKYTNGLMKRGASGDSIDQLDIADISIHLVVEQLQQRLLLL